MQNRRKGISQWLYHYLEKHPIYALVVYFTSLFEPVLYMASIFISANVVDVVANNGGFADVWLELRILIPYGLIQVLFFFLSSFLNEVLAHRVTTDMTVDLFEVMQQRSLSYHDSKDTGATMTLAMNDTRALNMFLNPGIRMVIAAVTVWGVAAMILSLVNGFFVFILAITSVIFTYQVILYRKKVGVISTRVLEDLSEIGAITNSTFAGIRDIKTYTANKLFASKFKKKAIKQAISMELEGRQGAIFWPKLTIFIVTSGIIAYNVYLLFLGEISYGQLIMVTLALRLVSGFSNEFKWVSFIFASGWAASERLHSFFMEDDRYQIAQGKIPFDNLPASIEFENVSFTYNDTGTAIPVLDDVSFRIEENETVAVVGGPGSGKSSLIKLIQRLYLPQGGSVRIGGIEIDKLDNVSFRKHMATVEQDVFLFNDTVFENIRFGRPDASIEEVKKIAKLAHAHQFINDFDNGYDTIIGDNGVRLSGGQAQRVAIARALLINPAILILDDGASALDAKTELEIQNSINEILRTRTTVVTTHRLAIIARADKVLILDHGRVVGFDSHEVLIRTNTHYRKFFEMHYKLPELEVIS